MTNFAPESKPLQSKKFVAYLVAEATWKIVLILILVSGLNSGHINVILGTVAMAVVVVAGFIEAGYIIGQASLDKYIRVAQIASQNGTAVNMGGMQMGGPVVAPTPPEAVVATNTEQPPVG